MDLDIPFMLSFTTVGVIYLCSNLIVLAIVSWQVLVVSLPMIYAAIRLQVLNKFIFENIVILKLCLLCILF